MARRDAKGRFTYAPPDHNAAAARFFGWLVVLVLALVVWSGYAHAEGLDGGAPCVPDAGSPEVPLAVDGGAAPPVAIHRCQLAPADGVFLTTEKAAQLASERAAFRAALAEAIKEQEPIGTVPAWVWVVACAAGAGVGAYAAKKVK